MLFLSLLLNTIKCSPLVISHRGLSSLLPENSLQAFMAACYQETDYIELDIHLTKDLQMVVMHDQTLDRTTNTWDG